MLAEQKKRFSRWGPPNERTVIDNVACILPSELKPETLRPLLMRFKLEEIHYLFDNVNEEMKNILFNEDNFKKNVDKKLVQPSDVRARRKLAQEQSQVIESIRKIYPEFQLKVYEDLTDQVARMKDLYIITKEQLLFILSDNGENLKKIERKFNIRTRITEVPINVQRNVNFKFRDALCRVVLIGETDEDIDGCYEYLQNEFRYLLSQTEKPILMQPDNIQNESNSIPPWANQNESDDESIDEQKDLKAQLSRLLENQDPPGS